MGLFSFLSKNKEKDALDELAALTGGGTVQHKPNDHVWEWRGKTGGLDARVQLGGPNPEAWIRSAHDHGSFTLEYDPSLVQGAGDSPEEAWSDDDVVRLFVGPGAYLESFAFAMPEEAAAFRALPDEGATRIVAAMASHRATGVSTQSGELRLRFDPQAEIEQMSRFMGLVAGIIAKPPSAEAIHARAAAENGEDDWSGRRVRCEYCRCNFLLGPEGKCPNCGAPA